MKKHRYGDCIYLFCIDTVALYPFQKLSFCFLLFHINHKKITLLNKKNIQNKNIDTYFIIMSRAKNIEQSYSKKSFHVATSTLIIAQFKFCFASAKHA